MVAWGWLLVAFGGGAFCVLVAAGVWLTGALAQDEQEVYGDE